jgi:hypothetical protein
MGQRDGDSIAHAPRALSIRVAAAIGIQPEWPVYGKSKLSIARLLSAEVSTLAPCARAFQLATQRGCLTMRR